MRMNLHQHILPSRPHMDPHRTVLCPIELDHEGQDPPLLADLLHLVPGPPAVPARYNICGKHTNYMKSPLPNMQSVTLCGCVCLCVHCYLCAGTQSYYQHCYVAS